MKKMIALCLLCVVAISVSAQKEIFQLNEYGVCEFVKKYDTAGDAETLYKKAKAWLSSANMNWVASEDVQNQKIAFTAYFNTATRYNPFAGAFTQDMTLNGTFVIADNHIELVINNMRVTETYQGYGMKKTETAIEDKMSALSAAYKTLQNGPDPSLSKKAQKEMKEEAKETIEDVEDVLTKAGEELQQRFVKLDNMFQ